MRRIVQIIAGLSFVLFSGAAMADRRADVVNNSIVLQAVAEELSEIARYQCGCYNTSRSLATIAELSINIEMEGRFGNAQSATLHLRRLVREVKNMKNYIRNIPNTSFRLRIKREIGLTVNRLGLKWPHNRRHSV